MAGRAIPCYRGTSLIRKRPPQEEAVSYERGTHVLVMTISVSGPGRQVLVPEHYPPWDITWHGARCPRAGNLFDSI